MTDTDFWSSVKTRFEELEMLLSDFRLPEPEDIEMFQLSVLTEGAVGEDAVRYNATFYAQPEKVILDYVPHLITLGLPLPKKHKNLPSLWGSKGDVKDIIRDTLKSEQLSPEFVSAWGEYNFSCAALLGLNTRSDWDTYHRQNIANNKPNLIERYVFAFWMFDHWINGKLKKEDARDGLADVLNDIIENADKQTSMPEWKINALQNMLSDDGVSIKKTYSEIPEHEIKRMVTLGHNHRYLFEIKQ